MPRCARTAQGTCLPASAGLAAQHSAGLAAPQLQPACRGLRSGHSLHAKREVSGKVTSQGQDAALPQALRAVLRACVWAGFGGAGGDAGQPSLERSGSHGLAAARTNASTKEAGYEKLKSFD